VLVTVAQTTFMTALRPMLDRIDRKITAAIRTPTPGTARTLTSPSAVFRPERYG
jgi:hypothetical protein